MTEPREIEAKFEVDAAGIERLSRADAFGPFVVTSRERVVQHDTYFDTPGRALAQASSSFRVRRTPAGALLTFKGARAAMSQANIASRLEDEIEVDAETADRIEAGRWLADDGRHSPVARAQQIAGNEPLIPTCAIRNERIILCLSGPNERELEMALDTCEGTRFADGRVTQFNEMEIETKRATVEDLDAVATALRRVEPDLRPNARTKLERVLR